MERMLATFILDCLLEAEKRRMDQIPVAYPKDYTSADLRLYTDTFTRLLKGRYSVKRVDSLPDGRGPGWVFCRDR